MTAGELLVVVHALAEHGFVDVAKGGDLDVFAFFEVVDRAVVAASRAVGLQELDWPALDRHHELQLEIVGAASSRTLWFGVHDGVPYVACEVDCIGGVLKRWPQQIEQDDRVVIRIDGRRAEARLSHVAHGTEEYRAVRAGRDRKYSGEAGGRDAAETAAHGTVVGVGEILTGRAGRDEPGDRLYRVDPR